MAIHTFHHIDICAGSGMLGQAVAYALDGNLRTVAYVERETYAAASLVARMDDAALDRAPVWDDVATANGREFVGYIRQFDPARIILTAGYPCQPFSIAGRRAGVNDERHLWPRIDELIGAIEPGIVFLENVAGHLRLGFAEVRRNLEGRGYRVAAGLFSAAEVGASHRRERLFILAVREVVHANRQPAGEHAPRRGTARAIDSGWAMGDPAGEQNNEREPGDVEQAQRGGERGYPAAGDAGASVADTGVQRRTHTQHGDPLLPYPKVGELPEREIQGHTPESTPEFCCTPMDTLFAPGPNDRDEWQRILDDRNDLAPSAKPDVCGVPNGLASGLDADRLRITGNGVVPLAAAYAFVTLAACLAEGD